MLKQEDIIGFEKREHLTIMDIYGKKQQDPNPTISYFCNRPCEEVHLVLDVEKGHFSHLDIWKKTQPDNYVVKRLHFSCAVTRHDFIDALRLCDIDYKQFVKTKNNTI